MNLFTPIIREVDIDVAGVESIDPVVTGSGAGNLTHTYTLSNLGPSDASGLEASGFYTFPAGVTPDSVTPSAGTWSDTNPGTWSIGNLAAGGSATLTITFTVDNTAVPGTDVIDSSVEVSSLTEPDTNDANDLAALETSIVTEVDIEITSVESSDTVVAGSGPDNIVHTFTATNNGPGDASGLIVGFGIGFPGDTTFSVVPSAGTTWGGGTAWNVGDLPSGASATLTISFTVGPGALDGFTVGTSGSIIGLNETDTNSNNNQSSQQTTVIREVDIAMTAIESVDPVVAGSGGGNLVHTITATNNGPSDSGGLASSATITFPAGVTLDSVIPSGSGTWSGTNPGTWTIGNLDRDASETLTITFTADPSATVATDAIETSANVSALDEPDTDGGNDATQIATSVERQLDLTVTKTDDPDPVVAGLELNGLDYLVTVTNNGPSDGDGVIINDPSAAFPAGVTLESHVASAGVYDGTDWVVDLPVGATETLAMVATVGPTAAIGDDAISNTAAVSGSGGGETIINMGDDSATAFTSVLPTTASWTVSKDFLDDSGASITASLTCSSGEVSAPVQVSESTPGVLTVERFLMGPFGTTSCEVTETLPPDYFPISASEDCEVDGFVHQDEFNCDFVNAPIQATFHVTKDFSDDNPAAVRVAIECNTGLPLQQEAMISEFGNPFDHVDFIVRDFEPGEINCDVFEEPVPDGYVQSYAASDNPGSLYGNISDDDNGCYFDAVESGTFDCAITNTLLPVDVTVNKQWIDEHPEYLGSQPVNITLRCDNADIEFGYACGGDECIEAYIDPNNPGVFSVFPEWDGTTSCAVTEEPEAGVLQNIGDCESIPLEPGLDGECTIVNTRLYAGIPTLNQHGLALLALLMLSMGLIARRRFG